VKAVNAVLCDMDGTLISTYKANFLSYNAACKAHGLHLTEEEFRGTWGEASKEFLPRLFPKAPQEVIVEVCGLKTAEYSNYLDETKVNQPLLQLLQLAKGNAKLGLVTNARRVTVNSLLAAHSLQSFFDIVVTGDEVVQSKPEPDCYLLALELVSFGDEMTRAIAIEDSQSGQLSAARAGIPCLMVEHFDE